MKVIIWDYVKQSWSRSKEEDVSDAIIFNVLSSSGKYIHFLRKLENSLLRVHRNTETDTTRQHIAKFKNT